jgi:hypothetical protein
VCEQPCLCSMVTKRGNQGRIKKKNNLINFQFILWKTHFHFFCLYIYCGLVFFNVRFCNSFYTSRGSEILYKTCIVFSCNTFLFITQLRILKENHSIKIMMKICTYGPVTHFHKSPIFTNRLQNCELLVDVFTTCASALPICFSWMSAIVCGVTGQDAHQTSKHILLSAIFITDTFFLWQDQWPRYKHPMYWWEYVCCFVTLFFLVNEIMWWSCDKYPYKQ